MIAARQIFLGRGAGGGGWVNPYVTDGLVAMWDGIWNAGEGVHDANATVWTDLINGRTWTGTNVTVESDAFVSYGVSSTTGNNIFTYADLIGTERTREIVIEPLTISFTNDPVMRGTGDWTTDLAINATRTPALVAFYRNGQIFYSVSQSDLAKVSLAVANKSNRTDGYVNGINTLAGGTYFAQQGNTVLPYLSANRVRIHAFRVYSRALTADEIARNYAKDKERFNLP